MVKLEILLFSLINPKRIQQKKFKFDDFIFSVTKEGKIASLEIKNATLVLEEMGLNPEILGNIKNAKIKVIPKIDSIFIGISIETYDSVQNIPIYLPTVSIK